jgi:general secretion pathway protein N
MLRGLTAMLVAAASIVATTLVLAPAQWMAAAVSGATGGHLVLAEATGSMWNGQAVVVLAPGAGSDIERVSLPETLSWQLSPWRLLAGRLDLTLSHPSALLQPLQVGGDLSGRIELGPTTVRLPATVLVGLGAPFNTIRPGGLVSVAWQRLAFGDGRMQGDVVGEWQYASSALNTVAPFGHYRLLAEGGYPGTRLRLSTVAGPLELNGDGTIDEQGGVRLRGRARVMPGVDEATRAQLGGLVLLLGPRDGETAILTIGH